MLKEVGLSLPPKTPALPPSQPSVPLWKKTAKWLYGGLAFLISTAALVELLPRLSASASPSPNPAALYSRFTVTNDGYLKITHVHAVCFISRAFTDNGTVATQTLVGDILGPDSAMPNLHQTLIPSDSLSVPCTEHGILIPATGADLAIIAYFRPWPFTFWHKRRVFRFVSRYSGLNGDLTWEKQPSSSIEEEFDHFMQSHSYHPE